MECWNNTAYQLIIYREIDPEFCAFIYFAGNADRPTECFHLCLYHKQSHTLSFAKRMEPLVQSKDLVAFFFKVYTQAIVPEDQFYATYMLPARYFYHRL